MSDTLTIHPLVPENYWDWSCLDRVKYHHNLLTIVWDKRKEIQIIKDFQCM